MSNDQITRLRQLYEEMYAAMVDKDIHALDGLFADSYELVHMSGARQPKQAFLGGLAAGTTNYRLPVHESVEIAADGDQAEIIGRTSFQFHKGDGNERTVKLQQKITAKRQGDGWVFVQSECSPF